MPSVSRRVSATATAHADDCPRCERRCRGRRRTRARDHRRDRRAGGRPTAHGSGNLHAGASARARPPANLEEIRVHRAYRIHRAHEGPRAQARDRARFRPLLSRKPSGESWPAAAADATPGRTPTSASQAALERVRATATGLDPAEFETAVCALFATLGFAATHVGGYDAPDGYLDAPLGPLAYRVMLECKTGSANGFVTQPNVVEAAKYRDTYGAAYCALVGPAFGAQTAFASELRTHGVSAWTVDDLAAVVHAGFDPAELRALFAPGLVVDVVDDAVWNAAHGGAKRVGAICDAIEAIAVRAQRVAIGTAPGDAPLLDVDAAMMLLDEHFAAAGSAARCSRADVVAAFDWLTHPRVGRAVWTGDDRRAIVVTAALRMTSAQGDA